LDKWRVIDKIDKNQHSAINVFFEIGK